MLFGKFNTYNLKYFTTYKKQKTLKLLIHCDNIMFQFYFQWIIFSFELLNHTNMDRDVYVDLQNYSR